MKYIYRFLESVEIQEGKIIYDSIRSDEKPRTLSIPSLAKAFETFISPFDSVALVEQAENAKQPVHIVEDQAFLSKISDIDKNSLNELGILLNAFILEEFAQCLRDTGGKVNPFDTQWGPYFSGLIELSELRSFVTQYVLSKNKVHKKGYVFVQRI